MKCLPSGIKRQIKGHQQFKVGSYNSVSVEPFSRARLDTMATMDDLPKEILMKIFSFLTKAASFMDNSYDVTMNMPDWNQDFVSLCSAALVSRVWRQVAEDPSLWSRFVLVVGSTRVRDLGSLNTITRFSRVQSLGVRGVEEHQVEGIRRLFEHRPIRTVFLSRLDLKSLIGYICWYITQELKHIVIYNNTNPDIERMTLYDSSNMEEAAAIETLLKHIAIAISVALGYCKLKSLSLNTCLFKIDPITMAKLIGSLEKLELFSCVVEYEEANAFVDGILSNDSLKMLALDRFFHAGHVDPEKLARAVHKLEYVHMVLFHAKQVRVILKMCTGETPLKTLKIWVPRNAKIFKKAIDKAKKKLNSLEINYHNFMHSYDEIESDDDDNSESEDENSNKDNDDVDKKEQNSESENVEAENSEDTLSKYPGNVN